MVVSQLSSLADRFDERDVDELESVEEGFVSGEWNSQSLQRFLDRYGFDYDSGSEESPDMLREEMDIPSQVYHSVQYTVEEDNVEVEFMMDSDGLYSVKRTVETGELNEREKALMEISYQLGRQSMVQSAVETVSEIGRLLEERRNPKDREEHLPSPTISDYVKKILT